MPVKVVTWNVNSINVRVPRVVPFIEREQPDILLFQELKCMEEKFPFETFKALGYHAAVFGQKTYNGVAILSRQPITDVDLRFGEEIDDPAARVIFGKTMGMTVASVYVPNGESLESDKFQYKQRFLKGLQKYLNKHHTKAESLLIAGDFNITPDDRDVWDPVKLKGSIFTTDTERELLGNVVDFGFKDSFRLHHEEPGVFTWWDYRNIAFPLNHGLRIDMIYVTSSLAKKCTHSYVVRDERKGEKPSDHIPVVSIFN